MVPLALLESQIDRVSLAESRFEMLKRPRHLNSPLTMIPMRFSCFALLHGVRRERWCVRRSWTNGVPHETSRLRINACGRFVQEDDLWFTHERGATDSLRLFPPLYVPACRSAYLVKSMRSRSASSPLNFLWGHSANGGVELMCSRAVKFSCNPLNRTISHQSSRVRRRFMRGARQRVNHGVTGGETLR